MAAAAASPPRLVAVDVDNDVDPFVSPAPSNHSDSRRQRYAGFDNQLFSIYSDGTPSQTKRALEAHLAETERRLQEASQLGTVLVQQRRELSERLKEVEVQQDATEIGPELRAKLVELEREFNEVGKDTARAFIPKSRAPSYHQSLDSDGNSIFTSEAQNSPSKLSVPSRKQRNQQPNRIHDIKLATEISSSLLNQVRELQVALAEKDEQLKLVSMERSHLEVEVEGLTQRLRALDESEQRYKDENWSLETRVQELMAAGKEAADKEHRLSQNLTTATSEKSSLERELEELKQTHGKLNEEHQATHKQHESEIMGLRRNATSREAERSAFQRKIEELTSQNQELARAVAYHRRLEESGSGRDSNQEADDLDSGQETPEHSPPPSPTKFTPRHSQLETETLKSSLQHAHRMIQNLKNNIHREKTEKMELRRVLQETKDELDIARREDVNGAPASVKKRKPNEKQDLFKKPARPDRLGGSRGARDEFLVDDGDWEDNDEHDVPETPSRRPQPPIGGVGLSPFSRRVTSASFNSRIQALNNNSTESSDAFETANELDTTETEAFQTGVESMGGSSTEEDTETEMGSDHGTIVDRHYSRPSQNRPDTRDSYMSTASTSGDELDSDMEVRTPQRIEQPRYRLKISRGGRRSMRNGADALNGEVSDVTKSPSASFMSDGSHLDGDGGKSLLAELGNLSGQDSDLDPESEPGTPGRSLVISPQESPELRRAIADRVLIRKASLARPPMVDSSMNTEPWGPESKSAISSTAAALGAAIAGGLGFGAGMAHDHDDEPAQAEQNKETTPELAPSAFEEALPKLAPVSEEDEVVAPEPEPLSLSAVNAQQIEPVEPQTEPVAPHNLQVSSISSLASEPVEIATPLASKLALSSVSSLHSEPVEPEPPATPKLGLSYVSSLHSEPIEPAAPVAPKLEFSSLSALHSEPVEPAAPVAPKLEFSSFSSLHSEPVELEVPSVPKVVPPPMLLSPISSLHSEPVELEVPAVPKVVPPPMFLSPISSLHSEPVEPEVPAVPKVAPPPMFISPISSLHSEPVEPPQTARKIKPQSPNSQLSSIVALHSEEPIEPEIPAPRELKPKVSNSQLSPILAVDSEPVTPEAPKVTPPFFQFSPISSLHSEPVDSEDPATKEVKEEPSNLQLSSIYSLHSEPVAPEAPAVPKIAPSTLAPVVGQAIEPVSLPIPEIFSRPALVVPVIDNKERTVSEDDAGAPVLSYANISAQHVEPEESTMPGRRLAAERKSQIMQVAEYEPTAYHGRPDSETIPESRMPFIPIASNMAHVERAVPAKPEVSMADESTQTEGLDELAKASKGKEALAVVPVPSSPTKTPSSPSQSSVSSPKKDAAAYKTVRRPGSVQSARSTRVDAPPLPPDHREVIAAAAQKAPMGPPSKPASAYKNGSQFRPHTPNGSSSVSRATSPHSLKGGTTPRARIAASRSEVSSPISRRTSVSSFASELDQRFNIPINPVGREAYDQGIDPRMVQAITQTMIGEFLWKYTRKAGREEMSGNRHRRFFWVHPYTRTLYWSDQDPATAGKVQLKAKSVQIEDVRIETDDNPFPPGLHRRSLIVVTPGRSVKFTAPTGQRHETWFNALSYLLLRTSQERDDEQGTNDKSLNAEDAREFNPAFGDRSTSRQTTRSRMSLSSYNSRTTRTSSPRHSRLASISRRRTAAEQRANTTTPPATQASMSGRFSSLSGMFRPAPTFRGSFSSRQSKTSGQESSIYNASVVQDSADDLRQVIEAQERDADRLENVRACCDGKHDVGSLSKKPHGNHHHHSRLPSHARASSFGASTALQSQDETETEATARTNTS